MGQVIIIINEDEQKTISFEIKSNNISPYTLLGVLKRISSNVETDIAVKEKTSNSPKPII